MEDSVRTDNDSQQLCPQRVFVSNESRSYNTRNQKKIQIRVDLQILKFLLSLHKIDRLMMAELQFLRIFFSSETFFN